MLPLIFLAGSAVAAITGIVGIKKGVSAYKDVKHAKSINDSAHGILSRAKTNLEKNRKGTQSGLTALGNTKLKVLNGCVAEFVDNFSKLKNIKFNSSVGMNELKRFHIDSHEMGDLRATCEIATEVAGGLTGGVLGGGIIAYASYGLAGNLAAASTGTAIANLSGAAATNATLAFFGGGSIASGGLGIAGGTMVLGGLVAGPALAVMGFIVGAKASAEKNRAYENMAIARKAVAEMDVASDMCKAITRRARMFNELLKKLQKRAEPLNDAMRSAIEVHNGDFEKFSTHEKEAVAACVAIIKTIKTVVDTPILTKNGDLTTESQQLIDKLK